MLLTDNSKAFIICLSYQNLLNEIQITTHFCHFINASSAKQMEYGNGWLVCPFVNVLSLSFYPFFLFLHLCLILSSLDNILKVIELAKKLRSQLSMGYKKTPFNFEVKRSISLFLS